jgi:transcriptional regulator with XRE-family HTH domain
MPKHGEPSRSPRLSTAIVASPDWRPGVDAALPPESWWCSSPATMKPLTRYACLSPFAIYGELACNLERNSPYMAGMMKTSTEVLLDVARRIKLRRVSLGLPQQDVARRAGVAYRTWQRMENDGQASIEDLVKAAVALRCEEGLESLFPEPAAANLDNLLKQQAKGRPNTPRLRSRVRRGRQP